MVDLIASALKQRLIEVSIAHLTGKIADRRINLVSDRDHAIKECAEGLPVDVVRGFRAAQTTFEDIENRGDLPVIRWCDLQIQSKLSFSCGEPSRVRHAVVSQSARCRASTKAGGSPSPLVSTIRK